MCWSLEVSVATSVFELIALVVISIRAFTSKRLIDREKRFILPILICVTCVEVVEVLLWMDKSDILPITERFHHTCSTRNARLTLMFPLLIGVQPMLVYYMLGNVCGRKVRIAMKAPFRLAMVYFASIIIRMFLGEYFDFSITAHVPDNQLHMIDFNGPITCTFLGLKGHFYWMVKMSSSFVAAGGGLYFGLMCLPLFLDGVPDRHVLVLRVMLYLLVGTLIYTNGTLEAGSVWCQIGFVGHLLPLIDPYLPLPPIPAEEEAEILSIQQEERLKKNI